MSIILIISTIFYCLLLLFFLTGMFRLPGPCKGPARKISVIIAARNEAANISRLIEALKAQNYKKDDFEIIIIDDRSNDGTPDIIQSFEGTVKNLKVLSIKEEDPDLIGKKGAITVGIEAASHELLAFTDADCLPGPDWLREINDHFCEDVDFIAGYSPLLIRNGFLSLLKNLERISIFAVTAGSFGWRWALTCTARNMAYSKTLFLKTSGFKGIGRIRSGDDDLLLQKMSAGIRQYSFMFSEGSIVPSIDKEEISAQVDLEKRRGSKWRYYPLPVKLLTLFCFLYFIFLIPALVCTVIGTISLPVFIGSLLVKILYEFLLLAVFSLKAGNFKPLIVFPVAELLYLPYFIYFGLKGTFSGYRWKD